MRSYVPSAALLALAVALSGCSGDTAREATPAILRLGYFANVTHAPARSDRARDPCALAPRGRHDLHARGLSLSLIHI